MQIHKDVIANDGSIRATWAEVNLSRLEQNLAAIRQKVGQAKVMLVAKANAYGHGLAEVSKALASKTDYIGVAVLEEGILLRKLGVTAPILIKGIWDDQILPPAT
jgi:alanine racemase